MAARICLYTEQLAPPYDEGYKNFTYHLFRESASRGEVLRMGRGDSEVIDVQVRANRLLLSRSLRRALRDFRPDAVIYVPVSSATAVSLVRAGVLKYYAGNAPVAVIGLQPRRYSRLLRPILRAGAPDVIYVQSEAARKGLEVLGLKAAVIHAGVDSERFRPVTPSEKARLREKYGIASEEFVVLHVGHIKERRNLRVLADFASIRGLQVVVVGSTSTLRDSDLASWLVKSGVHILDGYLEHVEEVYQLSDLYVFPVVESVAAIGLPLSVLEAMACNLPVVTTPFGGLSDCFQEGGGLYFVEDSTELVGKVELARRSGEASTRAKVEPFTWRAVAERFFSEIEELTARCSARESRG